LSGLISSLPLTMIGSLSITDLVPATFFIIGDFNKVTRVTSRTKRDLTCSAYKYGSLRYAKLHELASLSSVLKSGTYKVATHISILVSNSLQKRVAFLQQFKASQDRSLALCCCTFTHISMHVRGSIPGCSSPPLREKL
jgi:hypothetical protein